MLSRAVKDKFHREYMTFFENAEKSRRVEPVSRHRLGGAQERARNEKLALSAETFIGVECTCPIYIDGGTLSLFRDNFARAWVPANWGYERDKSPP